jgi:cytochrome c peroxidase
MGRLTGAALVIAALTACQNGAPPGPPAPAPVVTVSAPPSALDDEPLQPLPPPVPVDGRRAAIGERLFHDPGLSSDGTVSCATCHPLDRGGADGLAHSRGAERRETPMNTPTVFNVVYNFRLNWNGAYATVEDELDAPVNRTMGMSWPKVEERIRGDGPMRAAFDAAYASGVTTANIKDALASFIKTLTTPNARFDLFLRGDSDALAPEEQRGYELFKDLGCASCHQGANVGGNLFQRMGVMRDYFRDRGGATDADLGRFNLTGEQSDRHVFRVPSLRNVALTAPYFHDGSATTLEQAVATMGRVQLGRALRPDQVSLVAGFLRTLTGELKGRPLQ